MINPRKLIAMALAGVALAASSTPAAAEAAPGYHITDRIQMTDGWWDNAVVEPTNNMFFLTRGNGVARIDLNSGLIDYRFIPGLEGRAVIPLADGKTMMTTVSGYGSVIFFSTVEGVVSKMIQLDQAADGAAWDRGSNTVWAMGVRGRISIIDAEKLEVVGTLDLGEALESATSDGKGWIYVVASDSATVIAIDAASRAIVGKWKLADCIAPSSIAYVPESDLILSACFDNKLKIIDARTGQERKTVPVGKGAEAVLYDPIRGRAFVPSAYDGLLTVVAVNKGHDARVLETVRTQIGTRTGAVDPKTGNLYLPTARMGPIHKLGWPEAIPGTVELLVLEPK